MSYAGKWMKLEIIKLSETNQSYKNMFSMFFVNMESRDNEKDMKVKCDYLGCG
jgi:hypothetical protein